MAGSITLTNLSGYSLGVPADEASINIQKLTARASTEKIEVKDRVGHIVGRVDHSLKAEYDIEGFLDGGTATGSTLSLTAAVGALLTIASTVILGGVPSTGALINDAPQVDYETGTLAKISYKLTRYADIPATATQVNL